MKSSDELKFQYLNLIKNASNHFSTTYSRFLIKYMLY